MLSCITDGSAVEMNDCGKKNLKAIVVVVNYGRESADRKWAILSVYFPSVAIIWLPTSQDR